MKDNDTGSESRFGNSLNYFQKIIIQSGPAASASYTLVAAIIICTALGWLIDSRKGSSPYGVLLGLGLGLVSGFYQLGKTIWRGEK